MLLPHRHPCHGRTSRIDLHFEGQLYILESQVLHCKCKVLLRDQLVSATVDRLDALGWSTMQRLGRRLPKRLQPSSIAQTAPGLSDPLMQLEPVRELIQVLQSLPGFTPELLLRRMPRVLNEPETRRMGFQVAQGLAERGVVRLVRVAAGVPA